MIKKQKIILTLSISLVILTFGFATYPVKVGAIAETIWSVPASFFRWLGEIASPIRK